MCNTFMLIYDLTRGGAIVIVAFTAHHMPTFVSCNTSSFDYHGTFCRPIHVILSVHISTEVTPKNEYGVHLSIMHHMQVLLFHDMLH